MRRRSWSAERVRMFQTRKLRHLAAHAEEHVPFWRERFRSAGLKAADLRTLDDLRHLPVTTKAELQSAGVAARISGAFAPDRLEQVLTSGSSGRPFAIFRDPQVQRLRQATFLRTLAAGGYRPGMSMLLVSSRPKRTQPSWLNWHYASSEDPPQDVLARFQQIRPRFLYGYTTPLRQLASLISNSPVRHVPRAVFTTAETLDDATRNQLMSDLQAPIFDIYGSTETGTIGWECSDHRGYHLADDLVISEFIPTATNGLSRLVATPLDMLGMPLLRYDLGDIVNPGADLPCPCGCRFRRVERFEGRLVDCVRTLDGTWLSPFHVTLAIEPIHGIVRYQVIQDEVDHVVVRVERAAAGTDTLEEDIQRAVRGVMGAVKVTTRVEPSLEPPAGQKFRVVECRLAPACLPR